MDDLDHSIHIAEYDWTIFCEESEECGLLQPSLACLDDTSLTDLEDSENSSSVFSQNQQETQQNPDSNSDGAKSNTAGCTEEEICIGCTRSSVLLNQSGMRKQLEDAATKSEEDFDNCLDCPAPVTGETSYSTTTTLQIELLNKSSHLTKDVEVQAECDLKSNKELLSSYQTGLNVNEPDTTERDVKEDATSVSLRVEKERWFVTVNDSPARRVRATSVKKKRRQKKPCERNRMCTTKQEKSTENGVKLVMNEDKDESEGGRESKSKKSGGHPSDKQNTEVGFTSDSSRVAWMSGEEDNLFWLKENFPDPIIKRHQCELDNSDNSQDTLTSSQLETGECDEPEDSAEFLSIHSYDSETYLSAFESIEEPQHPSQNPELYCSLSSTYDSQKTYADSTQNRQMHTSYCSFFTNISVSSHEVYKGSSAEPSLTFPYASQRTMSMSDDNSTCERDTHSLISSQKHKSNHSASGFSKEGQHFPLSVPDLTVTPCSEAECPETYAKGAGHTHPVYVISAFWDEMEKLTINDILELRLGRGSPPRETQEVVTPNADDSPTNHSPVDAVECNLSAGTIMDTSDSADSDYFTQPDELRPDNSSCKFSISDFEEEYWQFIGASRNPTPDFHCKNNQNRSDSPLFSNEESTSSEGRETPVPLEDFAGQCFDNQNSPTLTRSTLLLPRDLTKSKSMLTVQTLNTEDVFLPTLLCNNESSLCLCRYQSLEENTVFKLSNSLEPHTAMSFLSNTGTLDYQISFPEVFEYFFSEDKVDTDSRCVTLYDPEDISVAPVFEYALCSHVDELSSSSLHCKYEKPIPIFSCSHPTVRELTLPKPHYVVLSANCEGAGDISPIRVVSHSFIQADQHGSTVAAAAVGASPSWKSFLSIRKIQFYDKRSIWCRGSGALMFPVDLENKNNRKEAARMTALSEGSVCPAISQLLREPKDQQLILETMQSTRRQGIFSTLKQSDMCLVCIAFASWVLRSSDPEADDAWKAALLANVSALSAIQCLRQYVKNKIPPRDEF